MLAAKMINIMEESLDFVAHESNNSGINTTMSSVYIPLYDGPKKSGIFPTMGLDLELLRTRLDEILRISGVSKRRLSLSIGRDKGYISQLLNKERDISPTLATIRSIADFLNIRDDYFYDKTIVIPEPIVRDNSDSWINDIYLLSTNSKTELKQHFEELKKKEILKRKSGRDSA